MKRISFSLALFLTIGLLSACGPITDTTSEGAKQVQAKNEDGLSQVERDEQLEKEFEEYNKFIQSRTLPKEILQSRTLPGEIGEKKD